MTYFLIFLIFIQGFWMVSCYMHVPQLHKIIIISRSHRDRKNGEKNEEQELRSGGEAGICGDQTWSACNRAKDRCNVRIDSHTVAIPVLAICLNLLPVSPVTRCCARFESLIVAFCLLARLACRSSRGSRRSSCNSLLAATPLGVMHVPL